MMWNILFNYFLLFFISDTQGATSPIVPCPANQIWDPCPSPCPEATCSSISGIPSSCKTPTFSYTCKPACRCRTGYVRKGPNDGCISVNDCCSDPNAENVTCPNPCPGGTCDFPEFRKCSLPCKSYGCQCKKGFVKNLSGKCISQSLCPNPCGKNETWYHCTAYCSYDDTCDRLLYGILPTNCPPLPPNWQCTGKCMCNPGLVRENRTCSHPDVCCSDPNAELVKCPNPCSGGTCNQPNFTSCTTLCKPYGCQCKKGFVKDKDGKCIPLAKCPMSCPANEEWDPCPKPCPPEGTCSSATSGILYTCRPPPSNFTCIPACRCMFNYVREGLNKRCVSRDSCCGPFAGIVSCPNPCPGGTCDNPEFTKCGLSCKLYGCQCNKGYVRDASGHCIPLSLCPKPCGKNETWKPCPEYCSSDDTCTKLLFGIIPYCPLRPPGWQCTGKCMCNPGFVRENGTCSQPAVCCSDPNAEFVPCPNPCPGGTCIQPNFTSCTTACKPYGCQCKSGFVKNSNGSCIPLMQCPQTCKTNEVWIPCPEYCSSEDTCANLMKIAPDCPPPPADWQCTGKCMCKTGFVREKGICSPQSVCCSDRNAEFVKYPNPCPGGTCIQPNFIDCKVASLAYGCQCKKGFVKDKNGQCITLAQCPVPCPANQTWIPCPTTCPPEPTCSVAISGKLPSCTTPTFSQICKPACMCAFGYARKSPFEGCILVDDCCGDANAEVVRCPNPCPGGTCLIPEFTKCGEPCKYMGCQCKNGFVKDFRGKCIPLSSCTGTCPANQTWVQCPSSCPEVTCSAAISGILPSCTTPTFSQTCKPTCKCDSGYVRKSPSEGCIRPNDCCGDPNAEIVTCPNPCPGGSCDIPEFTKCSIPCKSKGCQCKKGFVKDFNGKCIPLSLCPKRCPKNEVWNPCPIYCYHDDTCGKLLFGILPDCSPPPPNWKCNGKCVCNPGLVRKNGTCTEPSSVCCVDPNSEFVKCPNPCPGGTCDQPNFAPCRTACKPYGCQCKKGFVKNSGGKCIPLSECPKKCGTNEVWNPCVPYCTFDMTCERLIDGVIRDCARPPLNWQCSGACQCVDGFVRINGKCVNKSDCCSDPNSELITCPNPCPGTCQAPSFTPCKMACKKLGCQCKEGYVLNYKSECIPLGNCPRCGLNQHFDCGPPADKTCINLELDLDPYGDCVERCYCNEGYARNSQNACIPISDCNIKPTFTPKTTTPSQEEPVK